MFSSVVKETNLNGILFNVAKNETQSLQMHILSSCYCLSCIQKMHSNVVHKLDFFYLFLEYNTVHITLYIAITKRY